MTKIILLADDSSNIHKVVELTFLGDDFKLESALRGDEAIEKFSELSPDIVVADVHMPGVSGYEVCRHVKQVSPTTPVLLMVGALESFDEDAMSACGADNFLKKPFDSELLLQEVSRLTTSLDHIAEDTTKGGSSVAGPAPGSADQASGLLRVKIGGEDPFQVVARSPAQRGQLASPSTSSSALGAASEANIPEEALEAIAQRVIERLSEEAVREIAWDLVPDLAEVVIRDRLQELESELE